MDKNNQYIQCLEIIIFCMKACGIFPFIFSQRGKSRNIIFSRIITTASILLYSLILGEEILYLISTMNLLLSGFNFIIFIRLVFSSLTRIILISLPVTTWKNSNRLYTLWNRWQNLQEDINDIKQTHFILPTRILFRIISILYIFSTLTALPFKSFFNDYKEFAASIESFYYQGAVILSIITYWSCTCLFLVFVTIELQRLIKDAIKNEQHLVILRLLTAWLDLYDWKKEFISAHSNLFLIYILCMHWGFITSVYSISIILLFEKDKILSMWYLLTAFFCLSSILAFCESTNLFNEQIVVRIQEILLSQNITKINTRFLKQMETFFLTIEVHKRPLSLNGIITLNRSTILKIFAETINYIVVLKQFHQNHT